MYNGQISSRIQSPNRLDSNPRAAECAACRNYHSPSIAPDATPMATSRTAPSTVPPPLKYTYRLSLPGLRRNVKCTTAQEGTGAGSINIPNTLSSNASASWNLPSNRNARSVQTRRTEMSVTPACITVKPKLLNTHVQGIYMFNN